MQAEKVIARCRYLAQFTEEPGQIKRTFLSPAMRDCMQAVQGWMEAAGMQVMTDAAGNLRGRYPGCLATRRLMIGSHLDTVPNSGAFDGMLGVMLGLALVESLDGERLPFSIELVAFSEEEGVRFHLPFIGSRALVGRVDSDFLATQDGDGISIAQALTSFGLDPLKIKDCQVGDEVAGFLEFHIEQGILLESEDHLARRGPRDCRPDPRGDDFYRPGPPCRHDTDAAAQRCRGGRGGVGESRWSGWRSRPQAWWQPSAICAPIPGPGTSLPGSCAPASMCATRTTPFVTGRSIPYSPRRTSIAKRRGLTVASKMLMDQPAVAMDAGLCALATEAIRDIGVEPLSMVSGAGHDAMILAERVPSTMIFLRSPGGISHHPEESVRPQDVENALAAGRALLRHMTKAVSKEQSV